MIIDFEPLLNGEKKEISFEYEIETFDSELDVELYDKAKVKGKALNQAGYINLKLECDVPYKTECARCAKKLSKKLHIDYSCGITANEIADDELEYEQLEDGKLNVDELVGRCVILELPMTDLCSENCLGLCSECGKDLNEGPCGCKKPVDPRIQKIIDAINNG